ncbi:MAG: FecR domain-containing protein [Niastella sp.]|nr:FecR domain-containing protein [Niastella sp.]
MKTMERIRLLFNRYQQKTITAAEFDELLIWLYGLTDDQAAALADDQKTLWEQAKAGTLATSSDQVNWDRMLEEVLATDHNVRTLKPRNRWARIAVAASILVLLGAVAYLVLDNKKADPIVEGAPVQQKLENILPLNNKTVLTLAGGRQIVLDSANNGQLTDAVTKLQNGEIAYRINDADREPEYHTITVPRGGRPYQLQLADGSRVWLNAASSLKYPSFFKGESREVELTGEGYFEIATVITGADNHKRSFHVKHKDMNVEVLGTHFNVMAYEDESSIQTTLLEGLVSVNGTMIKPGQQAQYDSTGKVRIVTVNTDIAVAWVKGYFHFDKTDLKTILRQVGRWYNLDIVYKGNASTDLFSGKIERGLPLSGITKILSGIHLKVEGGKLIVE